MNYHYRNGEIPILILSIHGGQKHLNCPPREQHTSIPKFVKSNDLYTSDIAKSVFKHMSSLGHKPYLLVNKIHRKYVDLNRMVTDACSPCCLECKTHYYSFHSKLSNIVTHMLKTYNKCLIFDVHGNKHSENMLQLGYHITLDNLKRNRLENHSWYSFRDMSDAQLQDHIYKDNSLSYYLKHVMHNLGVTVFPTYNSIDASPFNGITCKYYSGTKTVMMNYKDICDVILAELSPEVRKNNKTPQQLAKGLVKYYKKVYQGLE
jgi:hypothetical protein